VVAARRDYSGSGIRETHGVGLRRESNRGRSGNGGRGVAEGESSEFVKNVLRR
jgi:hypothetical protein